MLLASKFQIDTENDGLIILRLIFSKWGIVGNKNLIYNNQVEFYDPI